MGQLSVENVYFSKGGRPKVKPSFADQVSLNRNVFMTEFANHSSELRSVGIVIYNCLFGTKHRMNDCESVTRDTATILKLKQQTSTVDPLQIADLVQRNPALIVILKNIDEVVIQMINLLLTDSFRDARTALQNEAFFRAEDRIFSHNLSVLELAKTLNQQERTAIGELSSKERTITVKYAKDLLFSFFSQLFSRQSASVSSSQVWRETNERSALIREVAESFGLPRKKVLWIFKMFASQSLKQ